MPKIMYKTMSKIMSKKTQRELIKVSTLGKAIEDLHKISKEYNLTKLLNKINIYWRNEPQETCVAATIPIYIQKGVSKYVYRNYQCQPFHYDPPTEYEIKINTSQWFTLNALEQTYVIIHEFAHVVDYDKRGVAYFLSSLSMKMSTHDKYWQNINKR